MMRATTIRHPLELRGDGEGYELVAALIGAFLGGSTGRKTRIRKAVDYVWGGGHGLKQRETRGIKIQQKVANFCGFFKVFDATPAGVLAPEEKTIITSNKLLLFFNVVLVILGGTMLGTRKNRWSGLSPDFFKAHTVSLHSDSSLCNPDCLIQCG